MGSKGDGPAIIDFPGYALFDSDWSLRERLRAVREALGLPRRRLATVLGVDEATLARWETGENRPPKEFPHRIGTLLQVPRDGQELMVEPLSCQRRVVLESPGSAEARMTDGRGTRIV